MGRIFKWHFYSDTLPLLQFSTRNVFLIFSISAPFFTLQPLLFSSCQAAASDIHRQIVVKGNTTGPEVELSRRAAGGCANKTRLGFWKTSWNPQFFPICCFMKPQANMASHAFVSSSFFLPQRLCGDYTLIRGAWLAGHPCRPKHTESFII